jgi:spore coat polysaccharide biosynthesis predicted glycosyltransferase SpsG
VVGGGISLYEACALGTPSVGVPVVSAQRPTVAGFVARGAALGEARSALAQRVADDALKLLRHERLRKFIARTAKRLVDGRGAIRAARLIAEIARER